MLRDARYAVGGTAAEREAVPDRYVAPAKFDANAPDAQPLPPRDGGNDAAPAKPSAKLLPPRPAADRPPADTGTTATVATHGTRYPSAATLVGSTCVVLSLFFAVAWLLKRASPKSMQTLPREAIELLGRTPLVRGQQMHLVRCGNRLLLLAVSATAAQTLAEIDDPQEVEALLLACGAKSVPHAPREGYVADRSAGPAERVSELLDSVTGPGARVDDASGAGRAGRAATADLAPARGTMAAIVGKGRHA